MKIIITGGAGFIGSQLGKKLEGDGHDVILVDNMSSGQIDNIISHGRCVGRLVVKDIRSLDFINLCENVDVIFHLAGIAALPVCQQDPAEAYSVNVAGLANVIEAARRKSVKKIIFSSTSAVYENTKSAFFSEDDQISPDLTYSCSKMAAEHLCKSYAINYNMNVIICRFFNIYGPHQDVLRSAPPFTSYVARELTMGRSPTLFNNSDVRRDYVYSTDVADALTTMMEATRDFKGEVFNICSGIGYSVPEIFRQFLVISGKQIDATYNDPQTYWDKFLPLFESRHPLARQRITKEVFKDSIGNPAKTYQEFGWRASTSLIDGVKAVYSDATKRQIDGFFS